MAEYSVMPEGQLHKIRQDLPMETACLAEPVACIANSLTKFSVVPGDYVVVLGAGPIGLLYMKLMQDAGAGRVIVSECADFRKQFAREEGAVVVDPLQENIAEFVGRETDGEMADIVVDCVGGLYGDAISAVAPGGRIILFGLNMNASNTVNPFDLAHHEVTTIGSYVVHDSFPRAIRILQDKVIDPGRVVTHVVPLEKVNEGFRVIADGEALKVIVKM
jgi:threonine dehydrogenase-like Zn-dependent dehydrogenase